MKVPDPIGVKIREVAGQYGLPPQVIGGESTLGNSTSGIDLQQLGQADSGDNGQPPLVNPEPR